MFYLKNVFIATKRGFLEVPVIAYFSLVTSFTQDPHKIEMENDSFYLSMPALCSSAVATE